MVKHHQITVKVHGWKPVKPVSVDRVGVYFRHALPDNCTLVSDIPIFQIVGVHSCVSFEFSWRSECNASLADPQLCSR